MKFLSAPKNEQFIKFRERCESKKYALYEIYETETHFLYIEINPEVDEIIETDTSIITNLVVHEAREFGFIVNNHETPVDIFYCTETEAYSSDLMLLADYIGSCELDMQYLNDHELFVTDRTAYIGIRRFSGKFLKLQAGVAIISQPNNRTKLSRRKSLAKMFGEIGIESTQLGSDHHKDLLKQLKL